MKVGFPYLHVIKLSKHNLYYRNSLNAMRKIKVWKGSCSLHAIQHKKIIFKNDKSHVDVTTGRCHCWFMLKITTLLFATLKMFILLFCMSGFLNFLNSEIIKEDGRGLDAGYEPHNLHVIPADPFVWLGPHMPITISLGPINTSLLKSWLNLHGWANQRRWSI